VNIFVTIMPSDKKFGKGISKKRKFHGNQHTAERNERKTILQNASTFGTELRTHSSTLSLQTECFDIGMK
jgi:hypothetical protein